MCRLIALVDKISKSFGGRTLYTNATLQLNAGERWALVGPNGAGKTTLLKILMGVERADSGTVSFAKDTTIGYLEQEAELMGDTTALQEVMQSAQEITVWEERITQLEARIADEKNEELLEKLLDEYGHARERFERLGGYELESRARQILAGLGFPPEDFDKPAGEFSGGWQMRISLSKLLLRRPDLLLLDEPTNHLDLESVQWLEKFLASYEGAVLIVSHDRAFMDACVSHVAALENKLLMTYTANYSGYLKQRSDNLEQLRAKRAAQLRDIQHLETFIERFRYKPTKAKQVQERIKRLEKIQDELVVLPEASKHVHFHFPEPPRTGDRVIRLTDIAKHYDDKLVYEGVNVSLYRGDHVALVGPNGAGKSTLMKLMCQKLAPSSGSIELGQHVSVGYYAQHQLEELTATHSVLQEMDAAAPGWTTAEERQLLGAFLFHGDDVDKKVQVLSGGERARLALAKMLVHPDPLLCLDEPTNHLDIDSVDVLEQALVEFSGTIVLISHDEHLVRSLATKVIDVRDHTVTVYDGNYDYYLEKRAALEADQLLQDVPLTDTVSSSFPQETSRKVKTKEQRRLEAQERNRRNKALKDVREALKRVEQELEPAQARYQELMVLMADEALYQDSAAFDAAMTEYTQLSKRIPELEASWLELTDTLESAEV